MGTKNNPGQFDCYANAQPDEPMFVLLARDPCAAEAVRYWVHLRANSEKGIHGDKALEALECADAMEAWKAENDRG